MRKSGHKRVVLKTSVSIGILTRGFESHSCRQYALLAQLVEATDLSPVKCGFESHIEHQRRIQQFYFVSNLAHLVEHQTCNLTVVGSNPTINLYRVLN